MPVSGLTDDRRNFHCVTVASVDLIPPVLRDILTSHIQPVNLYKQIKLKNLNLRKEQQAICFIPPASGVPDYNKFDVTLLYTLIRNLCHLPCPAQGWGNPEGPEATDTQISDDIERLRLFRNKYYAHRISAKISDNEFKDIWGNLTSAISRIQSRYNVDYKDEVIRIEQSKYTLCHWQECVKILDALADKPDIIIKGENEIICGGTAKFEADVNNVESSCWSIRWQRCRGDDVKRIDTTMKKYSGSTKRKLVIYDVCKEDEGEYQALLSLESNGPEYKSRNTVRLYAVGEIPFLNISEVTSGSEGITIHFECGVLDQSPEVHLIEWRKNGQELDNKSNKYVEEGINSRHLTIPSPNYEDRGNYNCKVSNAVGSVSKNVMLDVPSVELLEVSPIVYGFKTTLKPVISSTPTPQKINWQTSKDGVDFHSIKKAKDSYHADSSLVIHKATFADKLYYRLNVWNGIGETISNTVYLNVTGSSPNIKTISQTNIKKRSVNLIGNVIIYDDSPGVNTFFWTRNNKTIDFEECDGKLVETRTDNPSLTITNVGPDDAGEYRLTAINDVGSCTSEAIVLGVPKVSEEKVEDEDKGGLWITVTIKSIPEPFHVQWSAKRNEDDTFAPIDINAKEHKGTTVTLPHPVLFVKQKDQLENICFRIEVSNFIGSSQQDISGDDTTKQRKIDSVENTIYNDDGRIFEFTMLSSALVKHFPPEKLDHLKFLIKNSNKVKNLTSVKEATSVLKCIDILQDENLFTPTDVIYMQFLCQEADCFDLDKKCVEYAICKQRALCYFKKPPVNGYTDVQFHVQGDVSGYTKDYINHVIKTVAVMLRCKEEDVLLNGAQHSKSFLLSLSIKQPSVRKLLALEEKDRLKLRRLNIDYLIINGEILDIEIPKDQGSGRKEQSSCEEVTSVPRLLHQEKDQPDGLLLEDSSDNCLKMAENKYTKRRSELKKNLYKLLKEREPDGIPKAHLWNTYSSKVEKISAEFYNVKKMHKFLEVFDDMIKEVMVRGRPTIQLKDGYKPEGEKPSEVQIDRVSSSESEEVSTQGKEKVLQKPVKPVGSNKERESSGERGNTQKESPREEVVYQISTASPSTPVIPVLHQPFVPFPSSTLIRPLMGIPTGFPVPTGPQSLTGLPLCAPPLMMPQQLRQGAIARPVQDSLESSITDAVSEFLSKARKESTVATTGKFPDNPCVVSSGSSSESESSESESDSEVEETKPSKIVDEHKMKIEETRRKVKKNVVALLVLHPKGIKKSEIWQCYQNKFFRLPNKNQVGLTKLSNVLDLFDDVMEEYQDEHGIHYMRLKKKAQRKVSDSSDRSTPVIDLTKDEPSTSRRNLVNLTQDQSPSGFIPLSSSKPSHPGDLQMTPADGQPMIQKTPAFLLPTSQSIGFFQPTPQSQAGFIQPTSQSQDSLLRVGQLVIRPVSLRKFEPKETHLPRIWSKDKYGRFSQDQIQMVAKECIEALAEADEHVSVERVENMMLQRFGKRNIAELGNLRNAQQIPCLFDHNRMICKVNAYVQAYLNTHSICTLHELKLCMAEFAPDKDSFEALQIGPLQRLPIIYNHFKFPHDMADIPEITTSDIFENLRNYLNKYQKWSTKLELEHFMEYLVETYHVENAYVLGIRIRSLPLAMQVLKKSQRDAGGTRRKVTEDTKEALKQEIEQAFHRFRAALLSKRGDGQGQIRDHYLQLSPTKALTEIFDKYRLLCSSVEIPANKQDRRNHNKFVEAVNNFLQVVTSESFGRTLFHIALCTSKTEVDAIHRQFLSEATKPKEVPVTVSKKPPPTKDSVVKQLKTYLDRCQNHGALTLKSLDHIEERITEYFDFESFLAMGFGRFIEFLLKEAKQELDDCGGTSLGSGGHSEVAGGFLPTLTHILEFVHQCRQCNFSQEEQIQQAICHQFSVNEVKQLGHGTTSRLIGLADRPGKHVSNHHCVMYEAAVLPPEGFEVKGQTGILGHQTKEAALACLENCPLLENMAEWSQWTLVFEPQLGKLRDFIQKYGECQTWPLEGGNKIMKTDFIALESSPGQFLRLISSSSPEKFNAALQTRSPREVGGHLMSLVVGSKGVENTPRALLASHIKEELFKLHGEASVDRTPGAPASFQHGEAVVKFVLDCLLVLPVKSCSILANQMFLDPLGQVVGQSKSKTLLLQSCTTESQVSQLQKLGCMLGVAEWTNSIQARCRPSHASLEEVDPEIADEFFRDDPEPIDDSEDEEDSASTSYLSDVEVETEVKGQVEEEELIVVDESTEIEMEEGDVTGDKQKKEVTIDLTVKSEDNVIDLLSPEPKPEAVSMETDAEKTCRGIVEQIRREEFGIGVELNEDGQRLMRVQQERLGRSLDRLSKDLYSKDTHFVLELIQNADDNSYPDSLGEDECPSVQFIMRPEGVVVLNNETGFADKNIRALCDVGRSTKGKHKAGYIGQKGIGFKSVFRVTDEPEIHSNGFHIKFDVHSGPTGYILPQWVEEDKWKDGEGWTTKIVLPLKESIRSQTTTLAARFNDIHPSLLLFLNRLRKITIDNRVENFVQNIHRKDYGENVVEITHDDKMDRWLVVKKSLDASKISLQAKSGVEVESTEIALAFPLRPPGQKKDSKFVPPKQPVFAFLPLRSYGFRFIVQGDFDVPSSREDVDRDSSWNQWLRNEIHILFLEALEIFKSHADFSNMEAVISFLQFVPVEDEIIDFFRPVANQILQKLRAKPCVPTQPNSKGQCAWKIPSQMVRVKDPLVLEVVTPDLLKDTLNLFYLHRDVAATLNSSLTHSLGIESLNMEHLLLIGKSLSLQWAATDGRDKDSDILMTAKWLACVYRSLNEFTDNQPVYDKLKALKIIPLATYQRQCTADSTIFFPLSENTELSYNDPMSVLQQDLNTIHPLLVSSADSEVNSQVQKLLLKIGVCQLSPREVISHHILPTLKSNKVKERSENILISYIVYIKEQTEQDPSLINMEELGASAMLKTNKGLQNPSKVPIHFTPEYKNSINLQAVLPGYDWVLLDPVYLRNKKNPVEIQRWRQFFSKIGLTDFIALKQVNVEISNENIGTTPWSPLKEILGTIPKGSYIKDWSSSELVDLIQNNSQPTSYPQQMRTLCVLLAEEWDRCFSRYISTDMCTESGGHLKDVESSFSLLLRTASWVPGTQTCVTVENEEIHVTEKVVMMQPSCLYAPLRDIVDLLSYFVIYIGVQIPSKSSFGQFLGIKYFVDLQDLKKFLIEWGKRDSELTPKLFVTTRQHICRVYLWLRDNLPPRETQELFLDHPVIFVPEDKALPVRFASGSVNRSLGDLQAGRMLNKKEVWWSDPTGLIMKHSDIIQDLHSDLSKKAILFDTYGQEYDLQMLFQNAMRIDMEPSLTEYGELLVLMGQVLSLTDKSVLSDVITLYVTIGRKLRPEISHMPTSNPQTWMNVQELQIEALRSKFEGQKILATTSNRWVGIDDNPMIADNRELEKMFEKNDQVNFVVLEDRTPQPRRGGNTAMLGRNLGEKLMPFYEFCSVKKLTDCTDVLEITQMFLPCPELQLYMHRAVPALQRYLRVYKYNPDVYQELQKQNISQRLAAMQFFKVKSLEVKYSLKHTPDVFVIRNEKCVLKENVFYFHIDHIESYPDINKEIAKMFSNSDQKCCRNIRSFLNELITALTKEPHTLEEVMDHNEFEPLPEDEEPWFVKPPVFQVQKSMEPEIEEEEDVGPDDSEPVGQRQVSQTEEGEPCLKSWPPMSNTQGIAQNRVRREREEKPTDSKVWPPPQAPDYMKRVKELPSQFKVTDDVKPSTGVENTSRGGKSSGEGTVGGEVTKGEGYDRQESSEGSQNAMVSRQDSDGKGTKRKISENDTESKGENKRPVLDGEEASGGSHQGTTSHGGSSHTIADSASEGDRVKGDARSPKEWTGNDKRPNIQEQRRDVGNGDKDRDSENPRSSGKRRHPTDSSQGSPRMPESKRLLMDNPAWTEMASDYIYEELGQGSNLKAPPEILQDLDQDETSLQEIGRWGEQMVYQYLLQQREADPDIVEVKWCNREIEKGDPYDMEISRKTDSGVVQTFIEVKTTLTDDKDVFEISSQQIQFAQEHRENFHIYRVFNAGDLERVRLVRINNISLRMDQKQVRLWMMI